MRAFSGLKHLAVSSLLILAACSAPAPAAQAPAADAATEAASPAAPESQATPTEAASATAPVEPSATPFPEGLWIGLPTYPGDSQPDTAFQVKFDPSLWIPAADPSGVPSLLHQQIPGCQIVPAGGRGLPPGLTVNHDFRKIGNVEYEINLIVGADGTLQFVTYLGGDASIYTGFEVNFTEQADACQQAAEVVLATLVSVPAPSVTATPAELLPEITPTP
jgi:hypothetical protein